MKIYFDLVFFMNLIFDFILLLSVCYILKRNIKIYKIFLGALIGSISIFFLFLNLNSIELFIYKILLSILMIIVTFSFKSFKYFINNFIYLYLCSIVLGGSLYLVNNELKYTNKGLLFIDNGQQLNILIAILISPIILFLYIRRMKKLKYNYNNYYRVELFHNKKSYKFTAFLDTGNKLKDQYKKRPIILVNTDKINFSYENSILVPYSTVDGNGILKCIVVDKIIIDEKKIIDKPLIGLSNKKFNIDGIDMILNNETL